MIDGERTLDEEKATDEKLTELALAEVNEEAEEEEAAPASKKRSAR